MTGGMAFVYDTDATFERRVNPEHVHFQRIDSAHWDTVCRTLVVEHANETQSTFARDLLIHWDLEIGKFWQIVPFEMIDRLAQPLSDEADQAIA
jgi:glutamate synthase (NADPH/NADH) large chain